MRVCRSISERKVNEKRAKGRRKAGEGQTKSRRKADEKRKDDVRFIFLKRCYSQTLKIPINFIFKNFIQSLFSHSSHSYRICGGLSGSGHVCRIEI